ncbi:hypothetical protein [Roseinatronobacter sp. NSM]|uniref:hypothetical protein n=1 Tax=Roseinatronobacter sp. NSM TaxID=3457785 RepID=UPI0040360619
MATQKQPWVKFYTTDWRSDPRLKMCSMAARGLWIDIICLMHEAKPYGHLLVSGHRPTDTQLAVLVGAPPDEITALLGELESAGVFSRTREGVIYSRKLSRMAKKAGNARNNGRKGGNPSLLKERENLPLDNPKVKGGVKPQSPDARGYIGEEIDKSIPPPKARKRAKAGVGFLEELAWAAGYPTADDPPDRWLDDDAQALVGSWREMGLSEAQIIAAVRKSREHHRDPPHSPKALSSFIETAAGKAKREVRPAADPAKVAEFWEAQITAGKNVVQSAISPSIARIIVDRGKVSADKLREMGIAC